LDRFFLCDQKERIAGLDTVRAIAILMVLARHTYDRLYFPFEVSTATRVISAFGYQGVAVFFTLSGYLIGGILLRRILEGRFSLTEFYINRFLRIVPASWVALAFYAIPDFNPTEVLHYMFYLANYTGMLKEPAVHFWTLCVEEHFYLVLPFLLLLLFRLFGDRRPLILSCFLIGIPVVWGARILFFHGFQPVFTHDQLDFFFFGVVGALLGQRFDKSRWLFIITFLLPLAYCGLLFLEWKEGLTIPQTDLFRMIVVYPLTSIFCFALVMSARVKGSWLYILGRIPFVRWLATLSYSIYLYHMFVIHYVLKESPPTNFYSLNFGIVLAGSLILALASFGLVERPFLRLRKTIAPQTQPELSSLNLSTL
jgi:peptidoglycan/LPS O-acetylase OafA/YrhL